MPVKTIAKGASSFVTLKPPCLVEDVDNGAIWYVTCPMSGADNAMLMVPPAGSEIEKGEFDRVDLKDECYVLYSGTLELSNGD